MKSEGKKMNAAKRTTQKCDKTKSINEINVLIM